MSGQEQVRYMFVRGRPDSGTPNRHVRERGRAGAHWMLNIRPLLLHPRFRSLDWHTTGNKGCEAKHY